MEKAIKQRLLGGLVLVAGAALFLPILLDGSGSQLVVPPMPAAPAVPTLEAVAPGLEKQVRVLDQSVAAAHGEPATPAAADVSPDGAAVAPEPTAAPEEGSKVTAVAPAPEKPEQPPAPSPAPHAKQVTPVAKSVVAAAPARGGDELPQAWVVQVASLSGRDKADALVLKLRKKGFHGFVHHQGGEWKVLVGPELRKDVAESAKQRLASDPELRLKGWLQPYKP